MAKLKANPAARGRTTKAGTGDRLAKTQIAVRAGIDRETVTRYLALEGAPKPDEKQRYSFREAIEWIQNNAPKLPNNINTIALKQRILEIEAEERGIELGLKKGQFIERVKLEPAIDNFNRQLTDDLRAKFEFELPKKYEGKNLIQRQQMNADAIDWVLARLKKGEETVLPKS